MQYKLRAYARAGLVTMIVLLLLLVAFQSIWVTHGSATSLMNQVALQRTRSQQIVKDVLYQVAVRERTLMSALRRPCCIENSLLARNLVLILAYRSSSEERTQALNELQMTLPRFQQTQSGLQAGDASLGLPKRPPQDIQVLLIQSQLDYISLLNAAKMILAQPRHVDPAQVQVVLDHERGYAQMMSNVVTLWDQHIDDTFQALFFIESGFVAALLIVVCLIYFVVTRRTLALLKRQEAQKPVQELPLSLPQELKPVQVQVAQAQIDTPREGS